MKAGVSPAHGRTSIMSGLGKQLPTELGTKWDSGTKATKTNTPTHTYTEKHTLANTSKKQTKKQKKHFTQPLT